MCGKDPFLPPTEDQMSDFLFARPTLFSGAARVLDFMGLFDFYNMSRTEKEADARATYADWRVVGNDMLWAMDHEPASENSEQEAS